ncbi:MAG: Cell cycle checkpoint protein rad17 [Pycnora praestabilis]|nr:MAG: Cell cycle checkpoint protein rad17 [Pycnora praestabilis]
MSCDAVPPPVKRQKRLTVVSSDEDDERADSKSPSVAPEFSSKSQLRQQSQKGNAVARTEILTVRSKRSLKGKALPAAPCKENTGSISSPKSKKRKPETKGEANKGQSIHSFFNIATQHQNQSTQRSRVTNPEDELDLIQDDSLDEGLRNLAPPDSVHPTDAGTLGAHSRTVVRQNGTKKPQVSYLGASQKYSTFFKQPKAGLLQSRQSQQADMRPWTEKYAPSNLIELAVNKQKVTEVRGWLDRVFAGVTRKRLLILKGPSGSGKTTTISLLSQAMNFNVLEWRNPVGSAFTSDATTSMSAQFEEFIGRSGKFGSLKIATDFEDPQHDIQNRIESKTGQAGQKIVLIEEFPNTFTSSSVALHAFRSTIQHYLASNSATIAALSTQINSVHLPVTPLIMNISETLLTTTTASADSFTAHRLLGPEILNHPGTSVIEFNSIATTFLTKALELVIQKEACISGRRMAPGPALLQKLGEFGDVRSAIGSLEFLCLRGDDGDHWGGKVSMAKSKRPAKYIASISESERESLEMVTQREASLGIFHSVGKVVYNKRDNISSISNVSELIPQPPDHLSQHVRLKQSQLSIDELVNETGTSTQTFIAALHENYVLSCHSALTGDTLESIQACIESLSESDFLCSDRSSGFGFGGIGGGFGGGTSQGAGANSFRQDEISFHVAVRGLLFALPNPVKRLATPPSNHGDWSGRARGGKGNAFKMFYPMSLRLWRHIEEIEIKVEQLILRYGKGQNSSESKSQLSSIPAKNDREVDLGQSNSKGKFVSNIMDSDTREKVISDVMVGPSFDRREMILERLPYMAHILRSRTEAEISLPDIERVAMFRGLADQAGDGSDVEDDRVASTQWAKDHIEELAVSPPIRRPWPRKSVNSGAIDSLLSGTSENKGAAKLMLSDDDIEDF